MAIPAEYGLVKHFDVDFAAGETTAKTVSYAVEGGIGNIGLSSQLQGQGVAVFVDNPLNVDVTVKLFSSVKIYDRMFKVYLHEFTVPAQSDGGIAAGYGLIKRGFEVVVKPEAGPTSAGTVTVAIVPSNG